jgi:hypothetical protein
MSPQRALRRTLRRIAPKSCVVHQPFGDSVRVTGSAGELVRLLTIARAAGMVPLSVRFEDDGSASARFRA